MDIKKLGAVVVGGAILHSIANPLIGNMITGTTVSDQLITNTLPIIISAGAPLAVLRLFFRGV